jgi:hypothetical protein
LTFLLVSARAFIAVAAPARISARRSAVLRSEKAIKSRESLRPGRKIPEKR